MGKGRLKKNLSVFIQAAREREEALDHVFLSGPPGLGKTTLATIIAKEMDSELRITSAPALEKQKDLAGILTTLKDRSVFFIDEIHRLRAPVEEMLYAAMEDSSLDWIIGQGPAARTVRIPLPRFTLIGATTRPGSVIEALRTRFGIQFRINFYVEKEIKAILRRTARILDIVIEEEALSALASCCRGIPRVANRLMRRMRDYVQVENRNSIETIDVHEGLDRLGINSDGLEEQDRRLLHSIITQFRGGPVGIQALATVMGESQDSIENYYEPYLIRKEYLRRTPQGRVATEKAYTLFHIAPPSNTDNENSTPLF